MEGCPKTLKPSHRAKRETGGGKGHPVKLRVRFSFWWFFFVFCFYCSIAQLCPILVTPWTAACQASLSITNFQSLLKLMFIESIMPSNRLILPGPLLLPSVFPSIRVFSSESALHIRWPKYLELSSAVLSHSVMSDSLRPIDCSTPGLPVHHQLPELAQTHVH